MKLKIIIISILLCCLGVMHTYAQEPANNSEIITDQDEFEQQQEVVDNATEEAQNFSFAWLDASFSTITNFIARCIEVPQFPGMRQSSTTVPLNSNSGWVSTGVRVEEGRTLQLEWAAIGVQPRPRKYKVMYRIDPRFAQPQIFIQKYDYDTEKYVSDFHSYENGLLVDYQSTPEMTFVDRIADFTDYFNFIGRSKIPINQNDVINIKLDYQQNFFKYAQMSSDLGSLSDLSVIYTESPIADNKILYSNAAIFCRDGIKENTPEYARNCAVVGKYWDVGDNWNGFQGRLLNTAFNASKGQIGSCPEGASDRDNDPLCYYDQGRGMKITLGGTTIKSMFERFKRSPFSNQEFFYYKSTTNGELNFDTDWDIEGMYNGYEQLMAQWTPTDSYFNFITAINSVNSDISMNFLHFGRYLMEIEIGNANNAISVNNLDSIKLEYLVSDSASPASSDNGVVFDQSYRGNAPSSGYLFLRATTDDDSLIGDVRVKIANYEGSSFISDIIFNVIVQPIRNQINAFTELMYTGLVNNVTLVNIARLLLVLYIVIYGLMYFAGAVEITVNDIVIRVIKIAVIIALLSEDSWNFFNQNVFRVFVEGVDFLMSAITGVSSSVGNPFGFIDPIFDRYTNPTIFALLFIQMLYLPCALVLFSVIAIYALYLYIKVILQIVITYCVAFIGLAIMISLAPIFIAFMLFERTRSIYDNWVSLMFGYFLEPTILLIFFLLIDQLISDLLLHTVARACWDILIPLNFSIDLNNFKIPIAFSFSLPFLPGIPFYVPEILKISELSDIFASNGTFAKIATSSFLLFALSKLMGGMVSYIHNVVEKLSQVYIEAAPGVSKAATATQSIMDDLGKIHAKTIGRAASFAKKSAVDLVKGKLIDQKIKKRRVDDALREGDKEIDYDNFPGDFPDIPDDDKKLPVVNNENPVDNTRKATNLGRFFGDDGSPNPVDPDLGNVFGDGDGGGVVPPKPVIPPKPVDPDLGNLFGDSESGKNNSKINLKKNKKNKEPDDPNLIYDNEGQAENNRVKIEPKTTDPKQKNDNISFSDDYTKISDFLPQNGESDANLADANRDQVEDNPPSVPREDLPGSGVNSSQDQSNVNQDANIVPEVEQPKTFGLYQRIRGRVRDLYKRIIPEKQKKEPEPKPELNFEPRPESGPNLSDANRDQDRNNPPSVPRENIPGSNKDNRNPIEDNLSEADREKIIKFNQGLKEVQDKRKAMNPDELQQKNALRREERVKRRALREQNALKQQLEEGGKKPLDSELNVDGINDLMSENKEKDKAKKEKPKAKSERQKNLAKGKMEEKERPDNLDNPEEKKEPKADELEREKKPELKREEQEKEPELEPAPEPEQERDEIKNEKPEDEVIDNSIDQPKQEDKAKKEKSKVSGETVSGEKTELDAKKQNATRDREVKLSGVKSRKRKKKEEGEG